MANIAPPKQQKAAGNGKRLKQVMPVGATEQTPPDSIRPLQLKIPETKKNEFKAYAAIRGQTMNVLFLEMFKEYREKHD